MTILTGWRGAYGKATAAATQVVLRFVSLAAGLASFLIPGHSAAQGSLQALGYSIVGGPAVMAYATNAVGWSFVPVSDLLVTAVSSTTPQVSFWLGTNQTIATYGYAGPYGSLAGPSTNFQSVTPLRLTAGEVYFIAAEPSSLGSAVDFFAFALNGNGDVFPFTTSPYISQFSSYFLSPDGQWSLSTSSPAASAYYLMLGPNFQFQVVPEPSPAGLSCLAIGMWWWSCAARRLKL